MPASITKAQIRKLGQRLCASEPAAADLESLALLQDECLGALESVDNALRAGLRLGSGELYDGVRLTVSNRLKRDRRIIEKLRRGTELDRMQDIVGFRIVGPFSLSQQDELTRIVAEHFDGRVKDRRTEPSYGYRAVHVVALVDGFLVEVQIRTAIQDLWAQHMESISDAWGRELQYGGAPDAATDEVRDRRTLAVEAFKALSPLMAAYEESEDDLFSVDRELSVLEGSTDARDVGRRDALLHRRLEVSAEYDARNKAVEAAVEAYTALLERLERNVPDKE